MPINRDNEGYFVVPPPSSSPAHPAPAPEPADLAIQAQLASLSPALPPPALLAALREALDRLVPASTRQLLSRYLLQPLLSGITAAFTQEIFRRKRWF